MHTIDPGFILGIAKVSEFGARKYHMRNFLMTPGMLWSSVYESLMRHLLAFWDGEEFDLGPRGEFGPTDDEETNMKWSGLPHLHHVAWNVMVLCTYSRHEQYAPGDDRPSMIEHSGLVWELQNHQFREAQIANVDRRAPPVNVRVFDQDNKGTKLGDEMTIAPATPNTDEFWEKHENRDTPRSIVEEMSARLVALGYSGAVELDQNNNRISLKL